MADEQAGLVEQRGRQERASPESRVREREAQVAEREARIAEREARIAEREMWLDERERISGLRDKVLDRRMIDDEDIYPPMDA